MTAGPRLDLLLNPESVAVVGASPTSGGPATQVMGYLREASRPPRVHAVNPRSAHLDGYYATLSELPEVPDVVVVGVAARFALTAVEEGARLGVRAFVILSSGFAEAGPDGLVRQRELQSLAEKHDLTLIGPNSLGVMNFVTGAHLSFSSYLSRPGVARHPGGCAFVSQSGALATYVCAMTETAALFNYVFSMGNEASLLSADVVNFLADDPGTAVIALYLEGVQEGRRLLDAVRTAVSNGKHVVLLPSGEGEASARAASSHTAAMASSNVLTRMLIRQAGAFVVDTPEQLGTVIGCLLRHDPPASTRVGIVTPSGGAGAILAERLEKAGLSVPALSDQTAAQLRSVLPDYVSPANPCDTGAAFYLDPEILTHTMRGLADDPSIDQLITLMGSGGVQSPHIAAAIVEGNRAVTKPNQLVWFALPDEARTTVGFDEIQVAPSLDDAVAAAQALAHPGRVGAPADEVATVPAPVDEAALADWFEALPGHRDDNGFVAEAHARALLLLLGIGAGVPVMFAVDGTVEDEQLLTQVRFPVAAKIQSPDIQHKTEVGGVLLDIPDHTALRTRLADAAEDVRQRAPDARLQGWVVEPMAPRGLELLVTGRNDPTYGPVVVTGAGGVATELLKDIDAGLAPVNPERAAFHVGRTQIGHLLNGFRGARTDLSALSDVISRISWAVASYPEIEEIECNPVIVAPDGSATVVDVLLRTRR